MSKVVLPKLTARIPGTSVTEDCRIVRQSPSYLWISTKKLGTVKISRKTGMESPIDPCGELSVTVSLDQIENINHLAPKSAAQKKEEREHFLLRLKIEREYSDKIVPIIEELDGDDRLYQQCWQAHKKNYFKDGLITEDEMIAWPLSEEIRRSREFIKMHEAHDGC